MLRRLSVLIGLCAAAAIGFSGGERLKLSIVWALGDASGCSYSAATSDLLGRIGRRVREIEQASRITATDSVSLDRWSTPHGEYWNPRGNALFFDLAEQDLDVYGSGIGLGIKGSVVLDCGANVGTFTKKALSQGAARVVAFEFDPRNIAAFKLNFATQIADGKVTLVEKGVWDSASTMEAKFYANGNLNTLVMEQRTETTEAPQLVRVPLISIDAALRELGIARVGFIKMDVEGAEVRALEGARQTILRSRPVLSIATENELEDGEGAGMGQHIAGWL